MISNIAVVRDDLTTPSAIAVAAPYTAFSQFWARKTINFGVVGDTPIEMPLPVGYTRYRVQSVILSGATVNLSTGTLGLFTGPGATGTQIVNGGTPITVVENTEDTIANMQVFIINDQDVRSHDQDPLYLRVEQTTPGIGVISVFYQPVS